MQAPLRLHLCQKMNFDKSYSLEEIFNMLKDDYIKERHFTMENLARHIQALKAIGILEEINAPDAFNPCYSITQYGIKKIKRAIV